VVLKEFPTGAKLTGVIGRTADESSPDQLRLHMAQR